MKHLALFFYLALLSTLIAAYNTSLVDIPFHNSTSLNGSSVMGTNLVERKFHYHNNHITFQQLAGYRGKLFFRSFHVKEYYISQNQDPENYHHAGEVIHFGMHKGWPSLNIRSGRHTTHQTAWWFHDRIPGIRTTFNKEAEKLNFAFIGDFDMQVVIGRKIYNMTIPDVGVAQGHSGGTNNWWFGGKKAIHLSFDANVVKVPTTIPKLCVVFKRGRIHGKTAVDHVTADTYPEECDMV